MSKRLLSTRAAPAVAPTAPAARPQATVWSVPGSAGLGVLAADRSPLGKVPGA